MYSLNHEVPRTRGDIEQTSEKFMTAEDVTLLHSPEEDKRALVAELHPGV